MSEKLTPIGDLSCPVSAYEAARMLAQTAVKNQEVLSGTKERAIADLTKDYGFQSFLKKLHRGDKVSLHLHLYIRLCRAVEETADRLERKLDHDRMISRAARGEYAATQGTKTTSFGRFGATASAA